MTAFNLPLLQCHLFAKTETKFGSVRTRHTPTSTSDTSPAKSRVLVTSKLGDKMLLTGLLKHTWQRCTTTTQFLFSHRGTLQTGVYSQSFSTLWGCTLDPLKLNFDGTITGKCYLIAEQIDQLNTSPMLLLST